MLGKVILSTVLILIAGQFSPENVNLLSSIWLLIGAGVILYGKNE